MYLSNTCIACQYLQPILNFIIDLPLAPFSLIIHYASWKPWLKMTQWIIHEGFCFFRNLFDRQKGRITMSPITVMVSCRLVRLFIKMTKPMKDGLKRLLKWDFFYWFSIFLKAKYYKFQTGPPPWSSFLHIRQQHLQWVYPLKSKEARFPFQSTCASKAWCLAPNSILLGRKNEFGERIAAPEMFWVSCRALSCKLSGQQ